MLRTELGEAGTELAGRVQAATSGWPVAVRLVCETMRRAATKDAARVLDPMRHPGGTLFSYLAEEVLATESAPARRCSRLPPSSAAWTHGWPPPSAWMTRCSTRCAAEGCTSTSRGPIRLTPSLPST